jgi:hypothetical protein
MQIQDGLAASTSTFWTVRKCNQPHQLGHIIVTSPCIASAFSEASVLVNRKLFDHVTDKDAIYTGASSLNKGKIG